MIQKNIISITEKLLIVGLSMALQSCTTLNDRAAQPLECHSRSELSLHVSQSIGLKWKYCGSDGKHHYFYRPIQRKIVTPQKAEQSKTHFKVSRDLMPEFRTYPKSKNQELWEHVFARFVNGNFELSVDHLPYRTESRVQNDVKVQDFYADGSIKEIRRYMLRDSQRIPAGKWIRYRDDWPNSGNQDGVDGAPDFFVESSQIF